MAFERPEQFKSIGAEILGKPTIAGRDGDKSIEFNGTTDGIIIPSNPLSGLSAFTVELSFYPGKDGLEKQRILHLGTVSGDRVLVETRLPGNDEWFLDTFIASGAANCTLFNRDTRHPLGQWYHLALVFDGILMRNYVNGFEENKGSLSFMPQQAGEASIGVRLNKICWFRGLFSRIRISDRALKPKDFISR